MSEPTYGAATPPPAFPEPNLYRAGDIAPPAGTVPPAGVASPVSDVQPAGSSPSDPSAKDRAADVAQTGKQAAGDVAQTATDAAKDVAHETRAQAADLLGRTKDQLGEQAVAQKHTLVENLRSIHQQLESMTRSSDTDGAAVDLVARARDRAKDTADWLEQREPDQILDELRRVGRQSPGRFLTGALLAGVAAGRLTRGTVAQHTDGGSDTGTGNATGQDLYADDASGAAGRHNAATAHRPSPTSGSYSESSGQHVAGPAHTAPAPGTSAGLPLFEDVPTGYPTTDGRTDGMTRP